MQSFRFGTMNWIVKKKLKLEILTLLHVSLQVIEPQQLHHQEKAN